MRRVPWRVRRAFPAGDPAVGPDAGRGDRRIPAVPVRAAGPARELRPALRVLLALRPAAEPVPVRRPVRVESRDVRSVRNLRDAAASRRERPVRPEAHWEDAAVLQAQSKVHRPAWLLQREPSAQQVAAQSEQPLVPVAPLAQQPVVQEERPSEQSAVQLSVRQAEAEPSVQREAAAAQL